MQLLIYKSDDLLCKLSKEQVSDDSVHTTIVKNVIITTSGYYFTHPMRGRSNKYNIYYKGGRAIPADEIATGAPPKPALPTLVEPRGGIVLIVTIEFFI